MTDLEKDTEPGDEAEDVAEAPRLSLGELPAVDDLGETDPQYQEEPRSPSIDKPTPSELKRARRWEIRRLPLAHLGPVALPGWGLYPLHHGRLVEARKGYFQTTKPRSRESDILSVAGPVPGTDIDGNGISSPICSFMNTPGECTAAIRSGISSAGSSPWCVAAS